MLGGAKASVWTCLMFWYVSGISNSMNFVGPDVFDLWAVSIGSTRQEILNLFEDDLGVLLRWLRPRAGMNRLVTKIGYSKKLCETRR